MDLVTSTSEWDYLGKEGDVRLRTWGYEQWQEFLTDNRCAYEKGELGAEEFWYCFAKEAGGRIDGWDLGQKKAFLAECLARFYKLEVKRDNGQTEI